MTNTESFFLDSGSDQLARIYQWARARYAAPWAVFFAVLLRVSASVGPHVQLPGIIGGRASLNLLVAFVSASGGGKGISDKVGRLAWPTRILELPIGSGEGIAATFKKPDKEDENTIVCAVFNIPEIDTLAGIAARQGSILLAQLKSMAMGEQLGQSNASKATSRVVEAHSYRCCLSIGAQPGHTGVIFNDTTGGTPQRLLWSPTTDPDMPATPAPDPEPLDTALPHWKPGPDGIVEITYGIPEIAQTVIAAHIARQRGQADPLDGHRMLTRCKVAALLAIMHQRSEVSQWDWDRSADVMAISDTAREWVVTEARRAAQAKVRERAIGRATFDEIIDERHGTTVRNRILRLLANGSMSRSELRRAMGKQHYREAFDAVLPHLEKICQVVTIPGDKAPHYVLNPEFTGEPEFTPQNARSSQVNPGFTGEPDATVTDLDSRRSSTSEGHRMSAAKWFNSRIAELRAAGNVTTESFAVYAEGERLGYKRQALIGAASRHPDIRVIGRTAGNTRWALDPNQQSDYQPATAWFDNYLAGLPSHAQEIDRDALRVAGEAAGYQWPNVLLAARRHPRVESRPVSTAQGEAHALLLKPVEGTAS